MDEGLGAGDTSFYEKAQERMTRFLSSAGTLLLLPIPTSCSAFWVQWLGVRQWTIGVFRAAGRRFGVLRPQSRPRSHCQAGLTTQTSPHFRRIAQVSVRSTEEDAWRMRQAWWFTATSEPVLDLPVRF